MASNEQEWAQFHPLAATLTTEVGVVRVVVVEEVVEVPGCTRMAEEVLRGMEATEVRKEELGGTGCPEEEQEEEGQEVGGAFVRECH